MSQIARLCTLTHVKSYCGWQEKCVFCARIKLLCDLLRGKARHFLIVGFSYVDSPFVDGGKCGSLVAENRSLYRSGR